MRHFRFADSQAESGIQVSDPLVGLLGKLFSYVSRAAPRQLVADRRSLTPAQRRTLAKLNALVDRSIEETPAMAQRVMSLRAAAGAEYFLAGG